MLAGVQGAAMSPLVAGRTAAKSRQGCLARKPDWRTTRQSAARPATLAVTTLAPRG